MGRGGMGRKERVRMDKKVGGFISGFEKVMRLYVIRGYGIIKLVKVE